MLQEAADGIRRERSTSKEPLDDEAVRRLLTEVDRVIVARGKRRREFTPSEISLDDLKGPTGKYRAPIVANDRTLLVGFHLETLAELL